MLRARPPAPANRIVTMTDTKPRFILTLVCPDTPGIVHDVSGFILASNGNILESAQFGDAAEGRFCMRIYFEADAAGLEELRARFAPIAEKFGMNWSLADCAVLPRVLIMVSKFDHCLRDLLYRREIGELGIDVPCVVSNHRDAYRLTASYDIPFHHFPVNPANKREQEDKLLALVEEQDIDFIVLARYMQVLSTELCREAVRARHQHPSLLPARLQGREALSPGL